MLVRATEIAFERYGIARTTTNRIADIAGVSIGTVYQYFPTKEALVQAVVHRLWQAAQAEGHGIVKGQDRRRLRFDDGNH